MSDSKADGRVLLYDGVCGFCSRGVQTILRLDPQGTLRFAALQSDFGRAAVSRHPELEGVDSVVLLEPEPGGERVFIRSDAALRLAAYLGWPWKIFLAARLLPRPALDFLYDLFARNRYRFFGKYDTCMIPAPEVRARFIDA
jgi:predicted DCC family thiol-disulfide oxidoreductase YuxK